MKPLIERLKDERQEMIAKLDSITNLSRHLKLAARAEPDEAIRLRLDTDYARAAHAMHRVQARLGELKVEICAENTRLTAALREARQEARLRGRAGSVSAPDSENTTA